MLSIGTVYLEKTETQVRLCAEFSVDGQSAALWFGVAPQWEQALCREGFLLPEGQRCPAEENSWDTSGFWDALGVF